MSRFSTTALFLALAGSSAPALPAEAGPARDVQCKACVGKKDIGKKAISRNKLRQNAVTTNKIKPGAVNGSRLSSDAKPSGGDFATEATNLPAEVFPIATVDLDVPADGLVFANASAKFQAIGAAGRVLCDLTELDGSLAQTGAVEANIDADAYHSVSQTRGFPVNKGTVTIYWNCRSIGGAGLIVARPVDLTAIFAPNRY